MIPFRNKLPQLGINWLSQPELFPRYWAQLCNKVETFSLSDIQEGPIPPEFPDDASAAAGGIKVGGLYRTGNNIVVRLS